MKGKWERMMGEETMSEKEKAQRQYDPSTGIISGEEKQRNPLLSSSSPTTRAARILRWAKFGGVPIVMPIALCSATSLLRPHPM